MQPQCSWMAVIYHPVKVALSALMDILPIRQVLIRIQINRSMANRKLVVNKCINHSHRQVNHNILIRIKMWIIWTNARKSIQIANWTEFLPPPPEHPPPLPLGNCYVPASPNSIRRVAAQWSGSNISNHQKYIFCFFKNQLHIHSSNTQKTNA